jgi:hypothetical protein
MKALIERHPFISFIFIAYGWMWPLAALIEQSIILPLLGLFGPCVAAVVVTYVRSGRAGLVELGRKFRVSRALLKFGRKWAAKNRIVDDENRYIIETKFDL